jgi:hypothetical protein
MDDQRVARDQGIERVEQHSVIWRSFARKALRDAAVDADDLTSDDVWHVLREHGIPSPVEPRAMGPVMLRGVRDGWIEATSEVRISDDPASPNHKRPQRVYRSLVPGRFRAIWDDRAPWDKPRPATLDKTAFGNSVTRTIGYDGTTETTYQHVAPTPREFPLKMSEDGTVEVTWAKCDDCGLMYAVKTEHVRTPFHKAALAKASTLEGVTPMPAQPPIERFTERPKHIDFGDTILCPRCKGLRRKRKGILDDFSADPYKTGEICTRCGGVGVVPNKGPNP